MTRIDSFSSPTPSNITPSTPAASPPPTSNSSQDSLLSYEERIKKAEDLMWTPIFTFLSKIVSLFAKLWTLSCNLYTNLSSERYHRIEIPAFFPETMRKSCADLLAEKIASKLSKQTFSTIAELSVFPLPDLSASSEAEKTIRQIMQDLIKKTDQLKTCTIGKRRTSSDQEEPKISKLFIDAFTAIEHSDTELTLESNPTTEGDLTRLLPTLTKTTSLTLSTAIEKEITQEFCNKLMDLPLLNTLVIKPSDSGKCQLEEQSWELLSPILDKVKQVKFENGIQYPKQRYDWVNRMKKASSQVEVRLQKT